MKYKYVFLLGRPACGKSAVYSELEKRICQGGQATTCQRVDDFPKLWGRLKEDDDREKEGKERIYSTRTDSGAYFPHDEVWNDILVEVNADVLQIDQADQIIFLEFARSNYVEAIENFDRRILDRCLVIYIEVPFDLCWARNVARFEADMSQDSDDHHVYRETMDKLYRYDDRDALVRYLRDRNIPVSVVNNEADGEEHLQRQVEELFQKLF